MIRVNLEYTLRKMKKRRSCVYFVMGDRIHHSNKSKASSSPQNSCLKSTQQGIRCHTGFLRVHTLQICVQSYITQHKCSSALCEASPQLLPLTAPTTVISRFANDVVLYVVVTHSRHKAHLPAYVNKSP